MLLPEDDNSSVPTLQVAVFLNSSGYPSTCFSNPQLQSIVSFQTPQIASIYQFLSTSFNTSRRIRRSLNCYKYLNNYIKFSIQYKKHADSFIISILNSVWQKQTPVQNNQIPFHKTRSSFNSSNNIFRKRNFSVIKKFETNHNSDAIPITIYTLACNSRLDPQHLPSPNWPINRVETDIDLSLDHISVLSPLLPTVRDVDWRYSTLLCTPFLPFLTFFSFYC